MLKHFLTGLFVTAALVSAADTPDGVPKGATPTASGSYRFVDKDNKAWIYRKTPFGYQKQAEDAAQSDAKTAIPEPSEGRTATPFGESKPAAAGAPTIKVTEQGDTLKFERPTPFGNVRWTRKKDELTADERKAWEAQRGASTPTEKK